MNLKIIDTFSQINQYKKSNTSFSLNTWKAYAHSISPSLYEKCYADASEYTFESDVLPVVNDALYHHFNRIESAHQVITKIAEFLPIRASELFHESTDITIIFYLGLCNGAVWQLYTEGFATRYSQKLYQEGFYHQNQNGWLGFCQQHIADFKSDKDTSDFFGDWNSVMGQSNLGYYLGCEFIRSLEKSMSANEIACLSAGVVTKELYVFLEELK